MLCGGPGWAPLLPPSTGACTPRVLCPQELVAGSCVQGGELTGLLRPGEEQRKPSLELGWGIQLLMYTGTFVTYNNYIFCNFSLLKNHQVCLGQQFQRLLFRAEPADTILFIYLFSNDMQLQ